MRLLFVATLHHPQALEDARRAAPPGEEPLFPPSQGQYFWVKALYAKHDCRSSGVVSARFPGRDAQPVTKA